jgi:N-acetyl sugar amidotransferase
MEKFISQIKKIKEYQIYFKFLIIAVCTFIIYLNIRSENIIRSTLDTIHFIDFTIPFFLGLIIMILWSILVFNTLKGTVDLKIKYKTWAKIFFNSQFYNFIPFGGFIYKGVQLQRYNISYRNFLFNYLFIIWIFAIFSFLIFSLELAIFIDFSLSFFIFPVILIFPVFAISIFFGPFFLMRVSKKFNLSDRFSNFFYDLSTFLIKSIKKNNVKKKLFYNFFIIHIFDFFLYLSVINFLDLPISVKTVFLIWLINTIIDLFPITPQNIAVSELLAAFSGTFLGINFTSGMLVRIFVRFSWVCSSIFVFIFSNIFLRFEDDEKDITRSYNICQRCVMDTTDSKINFNSENICDYCQNFDKEFSQYFVKNVDRSKKLNQIVKKIKNKKKSNQKYDCVIGLSGGVDSSYLAHFVKKELKLNPLVLHVDTGWNSKEAVNNIEKIIDKLELDLHTMVVNWREMKDLQLSFFKAQLPNLDVPQDHAIFGSIYKFAIKNKIKTILTGGNFSTECIREPLEWAYHASDLKHILDVHKKFGEQKLNTFPFSDIFQYKLYYRFFKGLKVYQPLNFSNYNKNEAIHLLEKEYGWINYSHKHYESRFTKFFEGYWLRKKFGYDKRRPHFSSLILTNQMSRAEAIHKLKSDPYDKDVIRNEINYICSKLDIPPKDLNLLMQGKNKTFKDYKSSFYLIQFFVMICKILKIEKRIIR